MHHAAGQFGVFYERNGIIVQIREYLIGVTAAALICGIVKALLPEKSGLGIVVKSLLAVAMLLAAVQPLTGMRVDGLFDWTGDISADAQTIISDAEFASKEAMQARIKEQTEAYILAKAESLGAQLEVSVTLSDNQFAEPVGVRIAGAISPYAKQVLIQTITDDLGIDREAQQWIG